MRSDRKSKDGKLTTSTKGRGEIVFDLAMVGPSSAKLDLRTEVELDADGIKLTQVNTSTSTITSRAR